MTAVIGRPGWAGRPVFIQEGEMTLDDLHERIEQLAELPLHDRWVACLQLWRAVGREPSGNDEREAMIKLLLERTCEV